jgi:hypothetical protein
MKKYRCHKVVEAARIAVIHENTSSKLLPSSSLSGFSELIFVDGTKEVVSRDWLFKHMPVAGGYYVRYEDGYCSYSPQAAFEAGYKELDELANTIPEGAVVHLTASQSTSYLQRELKLAVEQGNLAREALQEMALRHGDALVADAYVTKMAQAEERSFNSLTAQVLREDGLEERDISSDPTRKVPSTLPAPADEVLVLEEEL